MRYFENCRQGYSVIVSYAYLPVEKKTGDRWQFNSVSAWRDVARFKYFSGNIVMLKYVMNIFLNMFFLSFNLKNIYMLSTPWSWFVYRSNFGISWIVEFFRHLVYFLFIKFNTLKNTMHFLIYLFQDFPHQFCITFTIIYFVFIILTLIRLFSCHCNLPYSFFLWTNSSPLLP